MRFGSSLIPKCFPASSVWFSLIPRLSPQKQEEEHGYVGLCVLANWRQGRPGNDGNSETLWSKKNTPHFVVRFGQ